MIEHTFRNETSGDDIGIDCVEVSTSSESVDDVIDSFRRYLLACGFTVGEIGELPEIDVELTREEAVEVMTLLRNALALAEGDALACMAADLHEWADEIGARL